ncbi:MAG: outer membrane beta-barrel protein [Bacteroidales bacterium]|nr:outer membrane beta-barrel protein [Bacteroidales bacterium]
MFLLISWKLSEASEETSEISGTEFKDSENVHFYKLSFIETKNNYPAFSLNKELSPAEKMVIDSLSYPYHNISKKNWISISFYATPAYTVSALHADAAFGEYLNFRKSHESGAVSWSAGADVQFNIKNWFIQTGLNYSTYSDKRNYNYTFKALDSTQSYFATDTTWGWVYDPPDIGRPIVLSVDTTFVPVYNEINEGLNTWKYLEIPLLVGYTFNFNRFSLDLGTGFSFGLLLGARGNVPSPTEENLFDDLSDLQPQMNRHNFNYILQIGAAYHLTPQWSLIVQPYYKQSLRSVFENNYPVDQRSKAFSIKFGLKVDL